MSLIRDKIVTFELHESGRIDVKTMNRVVDTNDSGELDFITGELLPDQVLSSIPHREVLNPESKDYPGKLKLLSESIVGQLAIQQHAVIQQHIAENSALKAELKAVRKANGKVKSD